MMPTDGLDSQYYVITQQIRPERDRNTGAYGALTIIFKKITIQALLR